MNKDEKDNKKGETGQGKKNVIDLEENSKKAKPALEKAMVDVGKWIMLIVGVVGFLYVLASLGNEDATGGEKLNTLFMRLTVIFAVLLIFVAWNVIRKIKYQREVVGKVYCEFITKEGNSFAQLLPMGADGMITIKARKKKKEHSYALEDMGTYNAPYPPGKWSFLQTACKKALLDEDSFEPLSNRRGVISLSPMRLANLLNERFTAMGVAESEEEAGKKGVATRRVKSNNTLIWVVLIMLGVAVLGLAIFIITKWPDISAALGV